MSVQELTLRGLSLWRQFDHSRLEEELLEAVYDTLLIASLPQRVSGARGNQVSLAAWQEAEEARGSMAAAAA